MKLTSFDTEPSSVIALCSTSAADTAKEAKRATTSASARIVESFFIGFFSFLFIFVLKQISKVTIRQYIYPLPYYDETVILTVPPSVLSAVFDGILPPSKISISLLTSGDITTLFSISVPRS